MSGDRETRVLYRAIADFTAVTRAARRARREIRDLRAEEARLNAQSAAANSASAARQTTNANAAATRATNTNTTATRNNTQQVVQNTAATVRQGAAARATARANQTAANAIGNTGRAARRAATTMNNTGTAARRMAQGVANGNTEVGRLRGSLNRVVPPLQRVFNAMDRLGRWRPRLVPPFIALIPAIAGVLALINPLVAGLGSVGGLAIGFASSLGRVGGAALAIIPALSTIVSLIAAMKTAMGGVGDVFSAFSSAQKAERSSRGAGGGGAATKMSELTLQERITRANERYRRSVQDVKFASDDLNEARKDYIRRLQDLQRAVDNAGLTEMRAAADVQLALEEYKRTMADPNASQGDRMAAEADYLEALEKQKEVSEDNKKNANDLNKMKEDGIEGDRDVIMAQRRVEDAVNAVRDAEIDLINTRSGANDPSGIGGAAAADPWEEFNRLMQDLSPSARSVVEQLLAMQDAWKKLKTNVQEAFFSQFVGDIEKLYDILPSLESMLTNTATAAGDFVSNLIELITSPEWQEDLIIIGEGNVPIIENFGDGVLYLLDMFKDLIIIVQPFLEALSEGFRDGAENLRDMVEEARETGSLGKWLMGDETSKGVLGTLGDWWQIIKNIFKTISNYSGAAEEFSNWLTDGLLAKTESWLKSSEDATKEDSPFKVWLENIKPLLSELSGLFGDFFGWFARESANTDNIDQMIDILDSLRTDLGPALADLFDRLRDAEIGPKFVDALTKIVDIIAKLADSGATDAFFTTLNALLDFIDKILENPAAASIIGTLATAFATFAAISFVAKFTGIENLISWLLALAAGGTGLPGLLGRIFGAFGKGAGAGGAVPRRGMPGTGGGAYLPQRAGAGRGGRGATPKHGPATPRRAAPRGIGRLFPAVLGGAGSPVAGATAAKGGPLGKLGTTLGKAGGLLGKGVKVLAGPVGFLASLGGTIAGEAIAGSAPEGAAGASQRVGGSILSGAASGAGFGAMAGSFLGPVGTAVGAGVGGIAGGVSGFFSASAEDRDIFIEETTTALTNFFTQTVPGVVTDIWDSMKPFGTWLGEQWDKAVEWFQNLPETASRQIGELWGQTKTIGTWLGEQWDNAVQWFTDLPYNTGVAIGEMWRDLQDFGGWLGEQWDNAVEWFQKLPERVGNYAERVWDHLQNFGGWLGEQWNNAVEWFRNLPENAANAVGNLWNGIKGIGAWLSEQGDKLVQWAKELPGRIAAAATKPVEDFVRGIHDGATGQKRTFGGGGRTVFKNSGGSVPGTGNGDIVPAMLTPGEFVVRKAITSKVGAENLARFNSGVMSFSELLAKVAPQEERKTGKAPKVSYFNAGGLVPSLPSNSTNFGGGGPRNFPPPPGYPDFGRGGITVEKIEINNPVGETSEQSLHSAVRKLDYVYGG